MRQAKGRADPAPLFKTLSASDPLVNPSKPQNRATAIPQNAKVRCSWESVSPWPGHPRDSTLNCSSNSCSLPGQAQGSADSWRQAACLGSPAWACLALFPRLGEPQEGSRGARPRFLLTLQVAGEALRVKSIIDERGYASALSRPGWGHLGTGFSWSIGLWLHPALVPAPPLADVVWGVVGQGKLLGRRAGAGLGQARFPLWTDLGTWVSCPSATPALPKTHPPVQALPVWGTGGACPLCPSEPLHTH